MVIVIFKFKFYLFPLYLQALLRVPTGVSQIVELIGESEVMRNEALLILQRLVAGNPDAQKVAMFSGCLDKIFSFIKYVE